MELSILHFSHFLLEFDLISKFSFFRDGDNSETARKSAIDILIATPGRLVDHINVTPGFTLEHLRFLVIDEADRLLQQSYQDWLKKILQSAHTSPSSATLTSTHHFRFSEATARTLRNPPLNSVSVQTSHQSAPYTLLRLSDPSTVTLWADPPLQKLIFSATLTRNPDKIASLQLQNPIFLSYSSPLSLSLSRSSPLPLSLSSRSQSADESGVRYAIPPSLSQYYAVCDGPSKPLVLENLMKKYRTILCFTHSVDTAHRLTLLLHLLGHTKSVAEFVGTLPQSVRSQLIADLKDGRTNVLVCSDVISRGIDFPNVDCVISYDPPFHIKTYVHRVGRTARAGATGVAVTLLEKKQVFHFKQMLLKAENGKAAKLKLGSGESVERMGEYEMCLKQLEKTLSQETDKVKKSHRVLSARKKR
jgi:ATP-dependent RNA helicase DDX51/DBP6